MSDSAPALEQGRHDRVGLVEDLGDDRLARAQVAQHVRVLRALTREEEGDLAGRAAAAEDAAWAEGDPGRDVVALEPAQRELGFGHQLRAVRVVDREPLGRAERGCARRRGREVSALAGLGERRAELVGQRRVVGGAEDERTTQRRFAGRAARRRAPAPPERLTPVPPERTPPAAPGRRSRSGGRCW